MNQARETNGLQEAQADPSQPLVTQAPAGFAVAAARKHIKFAKRQETNQIPGGSGPARRAVQPTRRFLAARVRCSPSAMQKTMSVVHLKPRLVRRKYVDAAHPSCVKGIKIDGTTELTVRACAAESVPNQLEIYPAPVENRTSMTTMNDGNTVYKTEIHSISANATDANAGIASAPTSSAEPNTPVGAIVGGVVGGAALIALIAFGIWFIRHQKKKEAAAEAAAEAARQASIVTPMNQMPMQFSMPPQVYPPVYQPSQSSPLTVDHPYQFQEGYLPADNSQQVPKPESPPRSPQELPLDNNRNSGPPVEML